MDQIAPDSEQREVVKPFIDQDRLEQEAVFVLYDSAVSGVELPVIAASYFRQHPEVLHAELDRICARLPNRVIPLIVDRLKAAYPINE
jgi:hypothetical protein